MTREIECFFDVGSPYSYLAWARLPDLARRTGATVAWRPILLGGLFKAIGNASPMAIPAKGRHLVVDLERLARRDRVALRFCPDFPVNTLACMRGLTGALLHDCIEPWLAAVYGGLWGEGRNLADPAELAAVLEAAGLDAGRFAGWAGNQAVKDALKAATEAAAEQGVFGVPTFVAGGELYFGQDRMDLLEAALAG